MSTGLVCLCGSVLVWQRLHYVTVQFFAKSGCVRCHLALGHRAAALGTHSPFPSSPLPSLHSSSLLSFPLFFSSSFLSLSLLLSSLSPSPLHPHLHWVKENWIFPFMAFYSLCSLPYPRPVLAVPTLPQTLSAPKAPKGNSMHAGVWVCARTCVCRHVFCHFLVDIKLDMLAKPRLCLLRSRFVSGGRQCSVATWAHTVTLTANHKTGNLTFIQRRWRWQRLERQKQAEYFGPCGLRQNNTRGILLLLIHGPQWAVFTCDTHYYMKTPGAFSVLEAKYLLY